MIWLIVILVVVALLVVALIVLYNRFVQLRNRVDNAWAQIEVQLKRRWDLIPNLVETVKGYAEHERGTFEAVTQARANAQKASGPAETAAAEGILGQALGRLFAVAEAYPELQADENFRQLQTELGETENRIAVSRQVYNDTVLTYNNAIQTFPGLLVAGSSTSSSASSSRPTRRSARCRRWTSRRIRRASRPPHRLPRRPPRPPSPARVAHPVARPRRRSRSRRRSSPRSASQASPRPRPTRSSRATSRSTSARTAPSRSTRTSRSRSPARSRTGSARSRSARGSASTRSACRRRAARSGPGASTELEPGGPPGTFGVEDLGGRTRVVWRFESDGFQERTFRVHYRLSGLAVGYDDVVDVNLKVWGDEWEQRLGRLTATMRGPGDVVRAWGHPVWVRGDVTLAGPARAAARARRRRRASSSSCARSTRATRSPRRPACRCARGTGSQTIIAEETADAAELRAGQGADRRRDREPVALAAPPAPARDAARRS